MRILRCVESSLTTKNSIQSGSSTGSLRPVGGTWARRGRRRSALRTSKRSGRTCVRSASGSGWTNPADVMIGHQVMRTEWESLVDLLRCRATAEPDSDLFAFLPDGEDGAAVTFTRGELDLRARALAARLRDLGLDSGRALLLYLPGLDFIAAFFG